jgi:hypothetical protein
MGSVNLLPRRCREALHTIITRAQEDGAQDIDKQMRSNIKLSDFLAVTIVEIIPPIDRWIRGHNGYGSYGVEQKDDESEGSTACDSNAPTSKSPFWMRDVRGLLKMCL